MKKYFQYFKHGLRISKDRFFKEAAKKSLEELEKQGSRTQVINSLLATFERKTIYLEIGVRNPNDNFLKIVSNQKFSVDPGFEVIENKADFKCSSDEFFFDFKRFQIF